MANRTAGADPAAPPIAFATWRNTPSRIDPKASRHRGGGIDVSSSKLIPAQQTAFDNIEREVEEYGVVVLMGRSGAGMTTITRALHNKLGGELVTARDFIEASVDRDPLALDETVYVVLSAALAKNDVVIVDDFHFIASVACCSHAYPRHNFLATAVVPLADRARDQGKTLIIGVDDSAIPGLYGRVPAVGIPLFTIADHAALGAFYLGERAAKLDFKKVHRFAPNLSARQLANSFMAFAQDDTLDTER